MTINIRVDGQAMYQTDKLLAPAPSEDENHWHRYIHQDRSLQAMKQEGEFEGFPESYIAINCAPTGAGKSMSWMDPAARLEENVMAMYPTKSLINDQYSTLKEILQSRYNANINEPTDSEVEYDPDKLNVGLAKFSSDTYDQYRAELPNANDQNGQLFVDTVKRLNRNNDFVIALTNPDIFSILRHNKYPAALARRISGEFDMLVVDEFHHADLKGQHSLVFLLEQMRREASEKSKTKRCMLLSATPEEEIQRKLELMDVPYVELNEEDDTAPMSEVDLESGDWRIVLPPVNLEIRRGQPWSTDEALLDEDTRAETLEFCGRDERTVIIIDGQREVERVHGVIERELGDPHYVTRIDGTTNENIEGRISEFNSSDKAILVTNSAGEIGVDYDATQLIFSGLGPSRLMQRFGRLRNKTQTVDAIAYVSNRAYERFAAEDLGDDPLVTRETFEELVYDGYKNVRNPDSFAPAFGAHEAYEQMQSIKMKSGPEERAELEQDALDMVENQFFSPHGIDFDPDSFRRRHEKLGSEFADSLTEFRAGPPNALVHDVSDGTAESVYTYNIMSILRTGDIEVVEQDEFYARLDDDRLRDEARKRDDHTYGYIRYHGDGVRRLARDPDGPENPSGRTVTISCTPAINDMLIESVEERKPRKVDFFQIAILDSGKLDPVDIAPLNEELQDAEPLAYLVETDAYTAKTTLELDEFFFLNNVRDSQKQVSVALAHDALYLYCIKQEDLFMNDPTKDLDIPIPSALHEKVYGATGKAAETPPPADD